MLIGYTSGVFDLFHVGHLNLFKNAKSMCDKLVVGVSTDVLVGEYKDKTPLIPFADRLEIVRSIIYVDAVVPQESMDKVAMCKKVGASIMFMGDDKYNIPEWVEKEKEVNAHGIKVIYFPYTKAVSTTIISDALMKTRGWIKIIEESNDG